MLWEALGSVLLCLEWTGVQNTGQKGTARSTEARIPEGCRQGLDGVFVAGSQVAMLNLHTWSSCLYPPSAFIAGNVHKNSWSVDTLQSQKNYLPSPINFQRPITQLPYQMPMSQDEILSPSPPLHIGIFFPCLEPKQVLCVLSQLLELVCASSLLCPETALSLNSSIAWLFNSFYPLFSKTPKPWEETGAIDVPFRDRRFMVFYCRHIDQMCANTDGSQC